MQNNTDRKSEFLNLAKYSDQEKNKLQKFTEHAVVNQSPKLVKDPENPHQLQPKQDKFLFNSLCFEAFGISDQDLKSQFESQILSILPDDPELRLKKMNAALAFLFDTKPKNALEGALTIQMIATHNLAMEFMARSMNSNLPSELITANIMRANKLLKTFSAQIETLQRLRSNCQQKVIVEHMHVHNGGQAVVGNISQTKLQNSSEGGGDEKSRG